MHVDSLSLSHFRNYRSLSLSLQPGLTIVAGENGQGKTNLLEAIFLLSGRSPIRFGSTADLIRWGEDSALISGRLRVGGRQPELGMKVAAGGRRLEVNGNRVSALNESPLHASLFCPETLSLVKEGAQTRRDLLDDLLERLRPAYAKTRADYTRVLRQRNRALQQGVSERALEPWDERLVELGTDIVLSRLELAKQLKPFVSEAYAMLSGSPEARASSEYESKLLQGGEDRGKVTDEFVTQLKTRRQEELARGVTTVGPHRDDVALSLEGKALRSFGSQGEQRSAALALVLSEARALEDSAGERPVLLLDDVLSELDEARRKRLLRALSEDGQSILTTTRLEAAAEASEAHVVRIAEGEAIDG